jgi:anaerobic magnesium-protoporphyrin IX monomethyl ester cyclase
VNYWGPQSKRGVKFGFDATRQRPAVSPVEWRPKHNSKVRGEERARAMACGGGDQQLSDEEIEARTVAGRTVRETATLS